MEWLESLSGQLSRSAWLVVPPALAAWMLTGLARFGPATRHAAWVVVLAWFLLPAVLPSPALLASAWRLLSPQTPPSVEQQMPAQPPPHQPAAPPHELPRSAPAIDRPAARPAEPAKRRASRPAKPSVESGPTAALQHNKSSAQQPDEPAKPIVAVSPPPATAVLPPALQPTRGVAPELAEKPPQQAKPASPWWTPWLLASSAAVAQLHALPPIPGAVWLSGVGIALAWYVLASSIMAYRLRRAAPAPADVVDQAAAVAAKLRLRSLPQIWMTRQRVSPLVWCTWRPVLLLPTRLWEELDEQGRHAVLCHELAHLHRGDHWIARLELAVCALFWWHPVAWWASRRIREEADHCCDAWVMALMPAGRRAYDQALLQTHVFIDQRHPAAPVLGAAMTSPGARRLARRLTMVMTQRVRPRPSIVGSAAIATLIFAGWLASPIVAAQSPQQPAEVAPAPATPPARETTIVVTTRAPRAAHAAQAPAAISTPRVATTVQAPPPPQPPLAPAGAAQRFVQGVPMPPPPPMPGQAPAAAQGGQHVRQYQLSPGKRDALLELLIRDDVPLRVREIPDGIEVHAPPHQQELLAAFVREIESNNQPPAWQRHELGGEELDLLYNLMARDDIAIYVRRGDDALEANVDGRQDQVLRGFISLLGESQRNADKSKPRAKTQNDKLRAERQARGDANRVARLARAEAERARRDAQRRGQQAQAQGLEAAVEALRQQAEELQRQAERLHEQAEKLHERAEATHEQQAALQEEIERASEQQLEADEEPVDPPQAAQADQESSNKNSWPFAGQLEALRDLDRWVDKLEDLDGWVRGQSQQERARTVAGEQSSAGCAESDRQERAADLK